MKAPLAFLSVAAGRAVPSRWDFLAVLLILGFLAFLAGASRDVGQPLSMLETHPVSLDPAHLPEYAARTTLRIWPRSDSR